MARTLSTDVQDEVKVLFLNTRSIRKKAREVGVSRNAVRRLIRTGEPASPRPWIKSEPAKRNFPDLKSENAVAIDFEQLTKIFEIA